jgi:alkylated DNA nucleotide flippase Atl1
VCRAARSSRTARSRRSSDSRARRRAVGTALAALSGASLNTVPGSASSARRRCTHRDGFSASVQRDLLEREGVRFDRRGHVDLKRARWAGPRREWVTRLRTEL